MTPTDGMVLRYDAGRVGKARATPQGGLRAPAVITRAGLFEYLDERTGKPRVEYHPPAVVAASVASLADAPVTDGHPAEMLTPENHGRYARGHVADGARFDEATGLLEAEVVIQDAALLRAVKAGRRKELSSGYFVKLDPTPGRTPDGKRYDAIVTEIVHNHAAMGPPGWARAGREAQVRLDGRGNAVAPDGAGEHMEPIVLQGERYDLSVDAERKAFERAVAKLESAESKARTDRDALQARVDAADKDLAAAHAEAKTQKERLDGMELATEVARCKAIAPDADFAKVANVRQAREVCLAALDREARLDGKSDAYLEAAMELAARAQGNRRPVDSLRGPAPAARTDATTQPGGAAQAAYDAMVSRYRGKPAEKVI